MLRAMVACGVSTALPVGFAGLAKADVVPTDTSLAGFHIGGDGRLYTAGFSSVAPVGATVVGVTGGNLSTVRRADGGVAVFTIGSHGGLVAGFTSASGSGMGFVRHPQGGLAPPGGRIAAVEGQTGIHVHFVGGNGSIYHAMYSRSGGVIIAPTPLNQPGSVLTSTALAAFQLADRFGVVFVGGNGGVHTSVGRIGSGSSGPIAIWTTTLATQANVSPAGSPVAAVSGANRITAFFTGTDGRLWRLPFAGVTPQPSVALSSPGAVPVRAHLAATMAPTGEFVVTYAGADGAIRAATDAFDPSPDPWIITLPGVHLPGNPLAITYGGDDYLYVGWCGVDQWIWLLWRWLRRPIPPPPPDPFHELREITSPFPTRQNFNVGVALLGTAVHR